ncbi:hypothetical protein [Litorimonas sp.]|uniref:hypothetical protein n=1 Tax=Litorimonas sp. TaxID=1892381 RepID=UPI003A8BDEC0
MLKLFFASSAMIPVIFMSLNVQAENNGNISATSQDQSYALSVEQKLDRMSECRSGEIPVYFHDAYITQHSAELINMASEVTRDCEIESFKVTLYDNEEQPEIMADRKTEVTLYLAATNSGVPVQTRVEESQRDSLWLNGRRAVIEFDLKSRTDLVSTS